MIGKIRHEHSVKVEITADFGTKTSSGRYMTPLTGTADDPTSPTDRTSPAGRVVDEAADIEGFCGYCPALAMSDARFGSDSIAERAS